MSDRDKRWSEQASRIREMAEEGASQAEIHASLTSALAEFTESERETFRREKQEFVHWLKERNRWLKAYKKIFGHLPELVNELQGLVASLAEEDLFKQAPAFVQERLQNRKEGLEMIVRMMARLSQRQEIFAKSIGPLQTDKLNCFTPTMPDYPALLQGLEAPQDPAIVIDEIIRKIEKEEAFIRDENYHGIRKLRQQADKLRGLVAGLLKDHFLPAFDGVERGIWAEKELKAPLEPYSSEKALIDKWFGAYHTCSQLLEAFSERIGLARNKTHLGDLFDPQRHTALGYDASTEFEGGQILEVARSGWSHGDLLIRTAEVVVVRNERGKQDGR